jgi:phosphoglycolate phosphatase-like HAD superfamily hydrolase
VGDGKWDLQASLELGWEFIGIASGKQAARLKEAGAKHVQTDFRENTP